MSVTGGQGEIDLPRKLEETLRNRPILGGTSADIRVLGIPGDASGRSSLLAFVRGRGSRTVVLTGHFDVVSIDDYGLLAPLAGTPKELAPALIEKLKETGADPLALADLESGDFLPGRGLLDMKSGLAAGLAVLESFAAEPEREGNLIFLAVPDEENQSAGMRSAVSALSRFAEENGLEIELAINLDALCDYGDGREGQVIATGTIGKLLLGALVVGQEAHACYPFNGINAAHLAAELVAQFEVTPELTDIMEGEDAIPPTVLGSRDMKQAYNVTIPAKHWVTWNVITRTSSASAVFAIARRLAKAAADRAAERIEERRRSLHPGTTVASADTRVITFAEAMHIARDRQPGFEERFSAAAHELALDQRIDYPTRSRRLAELVWEASALSGPAVMLLVASTPYPATSIANDEHGMRVKTLLRRIAESVSERFKTPVTLRRQFPAISDMSFLVRPRPDELDFIAANTPLWGAGIAWPEGRGLDFPVINVGPWGRDYHHWLERANVRYTFEVLPRLLSEICRTVLSQECDKVGGTGVS
jgi:arginine utilization protein RocB